VSNASNIEVAHLNIYDPRNLENLDNKSKDNLVFFFEEKG